LVAIFPFLLSVREPPIIGPLKVIVKPPGVTMTPLIVTCPDNNKKAIDRFKSR
jgi:hypothetical protein